MLRHIIIATWRNMAANRLISTIAILGLAVGIAAALLMSLVMRNQLSYDSFIPGYDRTFLAVSQFIGPGRPADYNYATQHAGPEWWSCEYQPRFQSSVGAAESLLWQPHRAHRRYENLGRNRGKIQSCPRGRI
jgi:hypothetical protein